jgi:protein-L-isoaspartate(D-aspartate) O-methyltransferase
MRNYEDTYQHKGLRKKLIDILKDKGITDENVLNAINTIPRHFFLDSAFDKIAYEDRAFEIAAGQTISQPYTVAYQSQLLHIKKSDKVLEIGTGSVYQATILAEWVPVYSPSNARKNYTICRKNIISKINTPISNSFLGMDLWVYQPMHLLIK